MTNYTDGPTDQPWEVEPIGLHADVQRRDFRARLFDHPDSREWLFELNTETQAREIAARLNRLDARTAALRRLVEAVKEYVDDYEALATCPCEECQLFRAAQAAREVLDG